MVIPWDVRSNLPWVWFSDGVYPNPRNGYAGQFLNPTDNYPLGDMSYDSQYDKQYEYEMNRRNASKFIQQSSHPGPQLLV